MKVHLRVRAPLDLARPQEGVVTIDRKTGLFAVRPLRRRRDYVLPLADVASLVVARVLRAESRWEAAPRRRASRR